jgi:dipeptidase D
MKGSLHLNPGWLESKILINTNSEVENEIYIRCTSSTDIVSELLLKYKKVEPGYDTCDLALTDKSKEQSLWYRYSSQPRKC